MDVQGTRRNIFERVPALNGADVHLGVAHPGVDDVAELHF